MDKDPVQEEKEFFPLHTHPKYKGEIRQSLEKLSKGKMKKVEVVEMIKNFHKKVCWRRAMHFGKKNKELDFKVLLN